MKAARLQILNSVYGRAFIDFIVAVIVVFGVTRRVSEGIGCDPEKNSIYVLNATPF